MHWVPRVLRICRRGKTCDEANRVKDKVFHLRDLSYQKFLETFVAVLSIKSLLRRYVDRTRILFSFLESSLFPASSSCSDFDFEDEFEDDDEHDVRGYQG